MSMLPKLAAGQRSVVVADVNTGIVITPKEEWYIGQTSWYRVFDSEPEAVAFAREYVEQHPELECLIYDEDGEHMMFLRKTR